MERYKFLGAIFTAATLCAGLSGCPQNGSMSIAGFVLRSVPAPWGVAIQEAPAGDIRVAAATGDGNTFGVVSVSRTGAVNWQNLFGGLKHLYVKDFSAPAAVSGKGTSYLMGVSGGNSDYDPAVDRLRVIALDTDGAMLFDNTYFPDAAAVGGAMAAISESDVVIAGTYLVSFGVVNPFLIRLSESGDVMWQSAFSPDLLEFQCSDIIESADGDIFCLGVNYGATRQSVLVKVSAESGNILWFEELDHEFTTIPHSAAPTQDGGAVLLARDADSRRPAIIRIDADGTSLWTNRELVDSASDDDQLFDQQDITVDSDGNIVVIGSASSPRNYVGGIFQAYNARPFVLALDADGNRLWYRTLALDDQALFAVTVLSDGTYAASGVAYSNLPVPEVNEGRALNIVLLDPADGAVLN